MTNVAPPSTRPAPPVLPGPVAIGAGVALGVVAGVLADAGTAGLPVGVMTGAALVAAGIPDLRERRIPNMVVLVTFLAAAVIAAAVAVGGDRPVVGGVLAGAAFGGGLLLILHLVRPASLGFGDVKLTAALGALLGVVHWTLIAVALGAAAVLGAVGAAVLTAWRRSIPFGSCLGVGALLAVASAGWWHGTAGLW